MALHVLTRDDSPYVPHSIAADLAAMIASCDAMTLERSRPGSPTRILSPAPAPAPAGQIVRDISYVRVPPRVVQGRGGMGDGDVSPPPSNVINIFIYIIFITLRAISAAAALPA